MCNWRLGVLGTNMVNALICLVFKMMCLLQETNAGSTTLFTIMAGYRGAVDPDKNLIAPETSTTNRAECTLKCHLNGGCTSLNFISAISGPSVCQLLNDKDDDPIRTGNSNDMYALVKNRQPVVPVDPNQCDSNPCTNGGTCVDGENEYTCQCLPEFIGTNCDQYSPNIYVFGGNIAPGATAYSDAFYKINVATYTTDTYSLTGYGTDFQGRLMSSIALNDSILFYSFNGPSWEDKYGIFSIADSSITTISTIPTGYFCNECHALVVLVGNTLVNCGKGVSNGKCVLHELSTGQTDVVDLPDNKNGACAVAISDTEMLWLGGDTNSVLSVNVVSKDYTAHATRNLPLTSGCAMYDADTMVMCGGFSGGALSTCHKLTVSSMQWSGMVSLQVARLNHRLIKVFGHLLAIGGMDSSYQLTTNMEWYDGSAWTESNDVALPIALADFAVVVHH